MIDPKSLADIKMQESYAWHASQIDEIDYSGRRPHLTCEDVIDAHFLICDHFYRRGEGIGGFGPRDIGLLNSAVARQVASAGGAFIHHGIWDICATLMFGLINNHPFHDANKRTAFLSSVFFLMEHNYIPNVDIKEVEDFTVEIASGNAQGFNATDIVQISQRLTRMFRRQDTRIYYSITYRELQTTLRRYNCDIENPSGNYINVTKEGRRVSQIGFPGWSRQVGRGAISTVRKSTGLTPEFGYDAQVFFKGADPLSVLIGEFEEPLRRLADR